MKAACIIIILLAALLGIPALAEEEDKGADDWCPWGRCGTRCCPIDFGTVDPDGKVLLAQDTDCASQPCSTRCDCEKRFCEQLYCSTIPPIHFIASKECYKTCWTEFRNCQEACTDGPPEAGPTPSFMIANGPGIDPNGIGSAIDPNGVGTDGGPCIDPNGAISAIDASWSGNEFCDKGLRSCELGCSADQRFYDLCVAKCEAKWIDCQMQT